MDGDVDASMDSFWRLSSMYGLSTKARMEMGKVFFTSEPLELDLAWGLFLIKHWILMYVVVSSKTLIMSLGFRY